MIFLCSIAVDEYLQLSMQITNIGVANTVQISQKLNACSATSIGASGVCMRRSAPFCNYLSLRVFVRMFVRVLSCTDAILSVSAMQKTMLQFHRTRTGTRTGLGRIRV